MEKKDAGDVLVESGVREMNPLPEFIGKRQVLWDKFKERYDEEVKNKTPQPIKIETFDKVCSFAFLFDNISLTLTISFIPTKQTGQPKSAEGESWRTTPYQIACKVVSKGWADGLVISKVDGVLWDLDRVLEGDCKVEFLKFDDEEGN